MRFYLILILCCLLALPTEAANRKSKSASAQKKKIEKAEDNSPKARPVFDIDGKFGFCLAEIEYPDGRKLTIANSKSNEVNLGLTIPKAGFALGGQYDLTMNIGKTFERKIRARAMDESSVLMQMENNPKLTDALKSSNSMQVTAGGTKLEFATPAMTKIFTSLDKCIDNNHNKINKDAAAIEQSMPETLKALLIASGIKDIEPLKMNDIPIPDRPADFVWRTGKLLGGVREREVPKGKGLSELAGLHIKGLKKKCAGTFKAEIGKEETATGLKLRPAEVSCETKGKPEDKNIFVAILFYLTATNRLTIFTHEAQTTDQQSATETRDAIKHTILQLARQEGTKKR